MLNGNIRERVLMGLGCAGRAEAFAAHRQLLVTPSIPLLSAAWFWGMISKQGIVSASNDFSEERNYSHKYGNAFFGASSAYVFGVFSPFSSPLLRLILCINIKSPLLCFYKTNPSRDI